MNKLLTICVIAASAAIAASCSSSRHATTIADLNGEWAIARIDGKPVTSPAEQETAFIGFNTTTGQLYGNASCNMLTGSFDTKAAPGVIEFTNMGSTRMMCPDMSLEQSVMSALQQVASYAIDRKTGDIELRNDSGKTLILLQKRNPAIMASNLHGEWTVSKFNDQPTDSMPGAPYVMTFDSDDNSFSCTTDCNGLSGTFIMAGNGLTFGDVLSTRMACPDSQAETTISRLLPRVTSFDQLADGSLGLYDQDNNLILTLRRK